MRFFLTFLFLLMPLNCFGQAASLSNKKLDKYHMTMIKKPKLRLTKNWAFVIDTSHSMNQDRVEKAQKAFQIATQFPTDEMNFCMFTFNDKGVDRYLKWQKASPDTFKAAHNWARKKWQRGVLSYAGAAIKKSLRLKKDDLTIIIISDGGFTEGYQKIRNIIALGQKWRAKSGFDPAIIACIGVQNLYYRNGNKEADSVNQQWLHDIGVDNHGGYSYVHRGRGPINPLHRRVSRKPKAKIKKEALRKTSQKIRKSAKISPPAKPIPIK
jgi:hypothetical protein